MSGRKSLVWRRGVCSYVCLSHNTFHVGAFQVIRKSAGRKENDNILGGEERNVFTLRWQVFFSEKNKTNQDKIKHIFIKGNVQFPLFSIASIKAA